MQTVAALSTYGSELAQKKQRRTWPPMDLSEKLLNLAEEQHAAWDSWTNVPGDDSERGNGDVYKQQTEGG